MQIQNVEALKSWLTTRLEPICDADPAALAKYVVALVKKDKPVEELKHVCKDQLEVFLSEETNKFVEMLFECLANHSYVPPPPVIMEPANTKPAPVIPKDKKEKTRKSSASEDLNVSKTIVEPSVPDDDERDFRRTRRNTDSITKEPINESMEQTDSVNRKRKAEEEPFKEAVKIPKEDNDKSDDSDNRRNGDPQPIPSTQSSRDRRYPRRDREFSGRNEDDDRSRRLGVPYGDRRRDRDRDIDRGRPRDRDRHHDGNQRYGHRERKTRCRDYEEKGFCIRGEFCPFDHGNDPVVIQDVPMQGMIPGFPSQGPFIHSAPPIPGMPVVPPMLPSDAFSRPPNQPPPPPTSNKPSVTEPSKSEQISGGSEHGKGSLPEKPVVTSMKQTVSIPPPVMMMPPIDPGIRPPFMQMPRPPRPPFPVPEDTYNPEQPQFERLPVWMRIGVPRPNVPAPVLPYNPNVGLPPRELVAVPQNQSHLTVQVTTDKPGESNRIVIGPDTGKQNKTEITSNNTQRPAWKKYNDTLEIKKIPREMNNITKLNEHFQKFGNIVNIQVNAFGDPEAALITFSKHLEAKAAYTCPDAVLSNRFIKVFWHNSDREQKSSGKTGPNSEPQKTPVKPTMFQSGKTTFVRQAKPTTTTTSDASTTETSTTTATPSITSQSSTTSSTTETTPTVPTTVPQAPSIVTTASTPRIQQRQDIMKKKLEIQKQKQELLDKQIQQQKLLISKLEKKNLSSSEKESIMKTLKTLSSNIESIKKEVEIAAMTAKSKQSPSQARQLAQKAILDQELDLITHQHTGEDTTELKKKVEELKQEAKSLGLLDGPVRGRGISTPRGRGTRGRGRGRGRGSRVWTKESGSSDAFIKQISVADVKSTEKDDIVEHFMEFGNVDGIEYDAEKFSLILTFRTRKEAEIAFKVRKLKDRMLDLSWYKPPAPTPPPTTTSSATTPGGEPAAITPQRRVTRSSTLSSSKLDDEDLGLDLDGDLGKHDDEDDEALLLGGDLDEEEDDEEDRSWRR